VRLQWIPIFSKTCRGIEEQLEADDAVDRWERVGGISYETEDLGRQYFGIYPVQIDHRCQEKQARGDDGIRGQLGVRW